MSTIAYRNYVKETFVLANTMVIKHDEIVASVNADVELRLLPFTPYNPNYAKNQPHTPELWRYYKNLNGEYHALDYQLIRALNQAAGYPTPSVGDTYTLDEMIVFVAGDNGPQIANFNKALITGNTTTANEYRYGTTYYIDLITRYPEHEHLVLGILNPVSPAIAIAATNGDILYAGGYFRQTYTPANSLTARTGFLKRNMRGVVDSGYIEDNEIDLLYKLQRWVKGFLVRWHNPDYRVAHDLYESCMFSIMYLQFPKLVMNFRLENCLTEKAHSYHVREFLESHGKLARYIPDLPLEQTLFLYRNVRWIEKHIGRQETFDLLVNRLATPSGVPLVRYHLGHDLTELLESDTLTPKTVAEQEVINLKQLGNLKDASSILDMVEKEIGLAKDNPSRSDDIAETVEAITMTGISGTGNRYPTKIIESSMLDFSDRVAFPLVNVLLNLWLFTAATDRYIGTIYINHPLTGHRFFLTPKNAFILMVYCWNRGYLGKTLVDVPVLHALNIPRSSVFTPGIGFGLKPTLSGLRRVAQTQYVNDAELLQLLGNGVEVIYNANSPDAFYDNAVAIQNELMRRSNIVAGYYAEAHQQLYRNVGSADPTGRGHLEGAMAQLYWQFVPCQLTELNYEDWFKQSGVDVTGMSDRDFVDLALEIAKKATGDRGNESAGLRGLQKAVIEIMKQFSSYAVQYIYHINDSAIKLMNTKSVRLRARDVSGKGNVSGSHQAFSVLGVSAQGAGGAIYRTGRGATYRTSEVVIPPPPVSP